MKRTLLSLVYELNSLNDENLAERVILNNDVQWCLGELQDILDVIGDMPIFRLRELAQADREGRCVVLDDITVADLRQMLSVLDSTRYGDSAETYTTGYRNGHRNGRIEILRHVLGIYEGTRAEAEAALRREKE